MNIRSMKAWLLTWQWYDSDKLEKIAAILSSRRSDRHIRDVVELIVMASEYNASDMAYFANKKRESQFKAITPLVVNGVPHGERMIAGHDPWLYARKVSSLSIKIDKESGEEIVSWIEPTDYKWKNEKKSGIEVATKGIERKLRRPNMPLNHGG